MKEEGQRFLQFGIGKYGSEEEVQEAFPEKGEDTLGRLGRSLIDDHGEAEEKKRKGGRDEFWFRLAFGRGSRG